MAAITEINNPQASSGTSMNALQRKLAGYGEAGEHYRSGLYHTASLVQFLGKTSGTLIDNPELLKPFVEDIAALYHDGITRILLPHGAGIGIDQACQNQGVPVVKIDNKRMTDERTLPIVHHQYNRANETLASALEAHGLPVRRITQDFIRGRQVDQTELGLVADAVAVNRSKVQQAFDNNEIVVATSMDVDSNGNPQFNINADSALRALVSEFEPHRTIAVTESGGIKLHRDDVEALPFLTVDQAQALIDEGVITDGMRVKTEEGIAVLAANPNQRFVIALNVLDELLKPEGDGTQLAPSQRIDMHPSMRFIGEHKIRKIIDRAFAYKEGRLAADYFDQAPADAQVFRSARTDEALGIVFPNQYHDVTYIDKVAVDPAARDRGFGNQLQTAIAEAHPKSILRTHAESAGFYRRDRELVEVTGKDWTAFARGVSRADAEAMSRDVFAIPETIVYNQVA